MRGPAFLQRKKRIRARGAAIAEAIERSKSTSDLRSVPSNDNLVFFPGGDRGRSASSGSVLNLNSPHQGGIARRQSTDNVDFASPRRSSASASAPSTPAMMRAARSEGFIFDEAPPAAGDRRRHSRDYQEHLRRVSDVVTRSPRRAKDPNRANKMKKSNSSTSLANARGRSSSVISLLSLGGNRDSAPPEIPSEDLIRLSALSGLSGKEVEERYAQFFHLADGKPHKGLSLKQFSVLYRRAFPSASNPSRLSSSVFRLMDKDGDGVVFFREFLLSLCVPSRWIPTAQKFRTLFRVFDSGGRGTLGPGAMATALRDLYDLLGLMGEGAATADPHRHAIVLFAHMDRDRDCKVSEDDFVRVAMSDAALVSMAERCNFCVPSSRVYMGGSAFFSSEDGVEQEQQGWDERFDREARVSRTGGGGFIVGGGSDDSDASSSGPQWYI